MKKNPGRKERRKIATKAKREQSKFKQKLNVRLDMFRLGRAAPTPLERKAMGL